jgi:hypothetical protein
MPADTVSRAAAASAPLAAASDLAAASAARFLPQKSRSQDRLSEAWP